MGAGTGGGGAAVGEGGAVAAGVGPAVCGAGAEVPVSGGAGGLIATGAGRTARETTGCRPSRWDPATTAPAAAAAASSHPMRMPEASPRAPRRLGTILRSASPWACGVSAMRRRGGPGPCAAAVIG